MIKKILSIIGITIVSLLAVILVIAEIPITKVGSNSFSDHSTFLRDCNSENANFGDTPITDIAMLGSHDACSYAINFGSASNVNEDNITNNGFLRFIAKGTMVRYSKAQDDNIYNQLKAGARWFDLRVTFINNVFYTSHGLISNTLEENIVQFLKFLDENPGEFALITINEFYKGTATWDDLYNLFENTKYNNKNIFNYTNYDSGEDDFSHITYNSLTNNGVDAGAVLFASCGSGHPFFHQFTTPIWSKWNNEIDTNALINKMNSRIEDGKKIGLSTLRVNQAQTTPSASKIWETFISWSLLAKAQFHNIQIVNLPNIMDIIDAMPITMFDYVTYNANGFNDAIIGKLKARNCNI